MTLQKRPDKKITYSYPDNFEDWMLYVIDGVCHLQCTVNSSHKLRVEASTVRMAQETVEKHNQELHSTIVHESIPRHAPDPYKGPSAPGYHGQVTVQNAFDEGGPRYVDRVERDLGIQDGTN